MALSVLSSGDWVGAVDWPVRFGKIDPGIERASVFYVCNEAPYFAQIDKPTTISFQAEGNSVRRVAQLRLIDSLTFFILAPRDLTRKNLEATSDPEIESSYPDLRIADSPEFWAIYDGHEKLKIRGLLRSGKLSAWARPNLLRGSDPVLLEPTTWDTHALDFHPAGDRDDLINQTFLRSNPTGIAAFYDVYLNRLQLRSIWPRGGF